jgi:hypothetical protein
MSDLDVDEFVKDRLKGDPNLKGDSSDEDLSDNESDSEVSGPIYGGQLTKEQIDRIFSGIGGKSQIKGGGGEDEDGFTEVSNENKNEFTKSSDEDEVKKEQKVSGEEDEFTTDLKVNESEPDDEFTKGPELEPEDDTNSVASFQPDPDPEDANVDGGNDFITGGGGDDHVNQKYHHTFNKFINQLPEIFI